MKTVKKQKRVCSECNRYFVPRHMQKQIKSQSDLIEYFYQLGVFETTGIKLRPELWRFVMEMERILSVHDAKKGDSWKTMPLNLLFKKAQEEHEELQKLTNTANEATDLANICMMIWWRDKEYRKEGRQRPQRGSGEVSEPPVKFLHINGDYRLKGKRVK